MMPNRKKQRRKCSIRTNPDCDKLKDKFLVMQAAILEKSDTLKDELNKMENECEETKKNYLAQMNDFQTRLKDQQTMLAEGTKTIVEAEEQSRLKQKQLDELGMEGKRIQSECRQNTKSLASEIC